jgi:hypothetical protein
MIHLPHTALHNCLQAKSAGKKATKAQQQLTTDKDQLLQDLQASRQEQAAADAKAQQLAADLASAEQKWLELQFLCEKVSTAGLKVNHQHNRAVGAHEPCNTLRAHQLGCTGSCSSAAALHMRRILLMPYLPCCCHKGTVHLSLHP